MSGWWIWLVVTFGAVNSFVLARSLVRDFRNKDGDR